MEVFRGGSWTAAKTKTERFMIITIITKRSVLDIAATVDQPRGIFEM